MPKLSAEQFLGGEEEKKKKRPSAEAFLGKSAEEFLGEAKQPTPPMPPRFVPQPFAGAPVIMPGPMEGQAMKKTLFNEAKSPKEFLIDKPAEAAGQLREAITEKLGPSVEDIEAQAAETGKPPYGQIAKRVGAETLAELVPMTPTDVALFGLFGAAGKGAGAIARKFPVVGRVAKTPLTRLGKRFKAIKRARGGPPAPKLIQPGQQPLRPKPLIKPGEEHLAPATEKNLLGPIDKTKPAPLQLMDAKKLSKPEANFTEPITPVEGPTVLAETPPVREGLSAVIQRDWIDRFTPIKGIPKHGIAPEFEQAGGGYARSYVYSRLMKGKIGGKTELLFDEVNNIVKPLRNYSDRVALNEIYSMKNFRDLDKAGRTTSGITAEDATKNLAKIKLRLGEKRFNQINKVADDLADIQNNKGLDLLVEAKIITPEGKRALVSRYPNYLRSEIVDETLGGQYGQFVASSGEPVGKINRGFLKTKLGTTKMINTDVIDVIRRSLIAKIAAAEKQQVIDQVAREFGKPIGKSILKKPRAAKTTEIKNKLGETRTTDQRQMVERFNQKDIPAGWVKSSIRSTDGKIVAVHPEVERMLQGLNTIEADIMTQMIGNYNNLFRLGATTYRLPFVVNNALRDFQTMFFNRRILPGQKSMPVAILEGAITSIKNGFGIKNEVMKDFLDSGAAFGGLVTSRLKTTNIPFRLRRPGEKFKDIVKQPIMLPFEEIGRLAQMTENTPRLAEFLRLRGTNLPKELRALNARDITVDFEKMGDAMKQFNRWIPFLNAQAQGDLNTLRALKAQPLRAVGRVGYLVTLPAVGLYAWNRQFKNNDTIDPYIKENYFYINTGTTIEREGREMPVLITARKGEAAKYFAQPLEAFLEWSENDPNFKERMEELTLKNMGSALANRFTPPPIAGSMEQLSNYDFFRKRPIVPERLKRVESGKQFTTFTSDTARLLGEKTGVSPVRIEHGARSIFPASPQIFEAADIGLKAAGIQPEIPRKEGGELRRSEAFFPTVRAPSGFFSPERAEAKRFKEEKDTSVRTPRFMFEEAYRKFVDEPTQENRVRAFTLAKQVKGKDRARIIKKIRKRNLLSKMNVKEQAIRRLPRNMQREFRQHLTEER